MSGLLDFIKKSKTNFKSKNEVKNEMGKILSEDYVSSPEKGEKYWLVKPFAMAIINKIYQVVEPKLSVDEYIFLERLHSKLRDRTVLRNYEDLKYKEEILFEEFLKEAKKKKLSTKSIGKIWYYIRREFLGYGKIDALLKDVNLEDISCSGYNLPVYVYHRAHGSLKTNIYFKEDELDNFALKLAQKANTQVSLESPIADASLPTGERIQITYRKVVSTRGSTFTIRKVTEEPITPLDLIAWRTISAEIMGFLWLCVESKLNLLITGATASGKTTLLNAISLFIPHNLKIISIEDTREVRLPHENWTPFLAKDPDDMFDLLKASLRQRPEYILVGEVRGKEAITMFQAMNTGHTTYSTLHAGDAKSAINRLIHEPINVPLAMFDALDLMIVLNVDYTAGKILRKMKTLYMIELSSSLEIKSTPIYEWSKYDKEYKKLDSINKILDKLSVIYGKKREFIVSEIDRRTKFLIELVEERPKMNEFVKAISEYRDEFYERL